MSNCVPNKQKKYYIKRKWIQDGRYLTLYKKYHVYELCKDLPDTSNYQTSFTLAEIERIKDYAGTIFNDEDWEITEAEEEDLDE